MHSTTKYMDGHAIQVGGVIVDSGNFNWENGKFGELCTPDESYHGVTYTRDFGRAAYITKARVQLMRDFGMYPSAQDAFLLNLGLETLAVRMERYCRNAEQGRCLPGKAAGGGVCQLSRAVRQPLCRSRKKIPARRVQRGDLVLHSRRARGGRQVHGQPVLANKVVHVADICTCVLHPASSTHRQLTDERLWPRASRRGLSACPWGWSTSTIFWTI